jgi:hypothetical protein
MSSIPPISTKRTTTSLLKQMKTKKTKTFGIGKNPCPGFGTGRTVCRCGRANKKYRIISSSN